MVGIELFSGLTPRRLSIPDKLPGSNMAVLVYRLPPPDPPTNDSRVCPSTPPALTGSSPSDQLIRFNRQLRMLF